MHYRVCYRPAPTPAQPWRVCSPDLKRDLQFATLQEAFAAAAKRTRIALMDVLLREVDEVRDEHHGLNVRLINGKDVEAKRSAIHQAAHVRGIPVGVHLERSDEPKDDILMVFYRATAKIGNRVKS